MSTPPIIAAPDTVSPGSTWIAAGLALAIGLGLVGLLFQSEIATAIYVWNNSDAYNYCFLVIPVAAYLAWDRRDRMIATALRPSPFVALLAIPAAAIWFVADRLGVMEGRQLLVLVLIEIMFASVLGWRSWQELAAPLLYLFFLVPFGEFFVQPLQNLAVHFTRVGLELMGVPNFVNGVTIEIPEGSFLVHQACSGLRFLVASAAFSVFYACIIYTNSLRRILFIFVFVVISIISNDFRVFGTILIAHFMGNAQAVETDHVLWGWLFYVIIGAIIVLIGLPFRQYRPPPTITLHARPKRHLTMGFSIAILLVVIPAAASRLVTQRLDDIGDTTADATQFAMPAPVGCSVIPTSKPRSGRLMGSIRAASFSTEYNCDGAAFVLTLYRYPSRINAHDLFLSVHAIQTPAGWDIIHQADGVRAGDDALAPTWRITEATTEKGDRVVSATTFWIAGKPTARAVEVRINQALNSLRYTARAPVLAVVTGPDIGAVERFLFKTVRLSPLVNQWVVKPEVADNR